PDTTSRAFDIAPPPPTTGSITVTTSTTGLDLDLNGYTVTVDDTIYQSIPTNSNGVTFSGLSAGNHPVVLSGVASNCSVTGGNSRTASVTAGQTDSIAFSVTCTAIPPTTGDLTVTTTTGGSDLDPDGYTVSVAGSSQSILTNGNVTFSGVQAGTQNVALAGIASNCTVSSANPMTVTVPAGGIGHADFAISRVAPNHPPVVNAGGNQTVLFGSVTVNWSFTDPDNDAPWTYSIDWADGS